MPFDTRHHVFKVKPRFPKEWRINEQRQAALDQARQKTKLLEIQKVETGELVDGLAVIEQAYAAALEVDKAEPELVMAGKKQKLLRGKR